MSRERICMPFANTYAGCVLPIRPWSMEKRADETQGRITLMLANGRYISFMAKDIRQVADGGTISFVPSTGFEDVRHHVLEYVRECKDKLRQPPWRRMFGTFLEARQ